MKEKAKAMVLASFVADSLSLGVHWIYDTRVIDQKFGRVDRFYKPMENSYHPTKDLGEFTHYGDQMRVLLESITACRGFDLNHFAENWRAFFQDYRGYFDHATKETLELFHKGKGPKESGSGSSDLAGGQFVQNQPGADQQTLYAAPGLADTELYQRFSTVGPASAVSTLGSRFGFVHRSEHPHCFDGGLCAVAVSFWAQRRDFVYHSGRGADPDYCLDGALLPDDQ